MTVAQQRIGRIQWGDLQFGPDSPYMVTAINGLDDLPDIRAEDIPRPDQHGDYTGPDTTGPRVIQLGLGLRADSPDELRNLTLALRAATQPQRQPAPLQFLDQDTLVYGKVRQRSIPYDAEYLWRTGTAALELYCADPYLYSLNEYSASTTAYSPAAGRTYPLAYTRVFPGANLVLNPALEVDLSNTASYSAVTRTRLTSGGIAGPACVQCVQTSTSANSGHMWTISPATGAGTVVYAGSFVRLPASGVTRLYFVFRGGGTTFALVDVAGPIPTGGSAWVTASYTLTAGQTCDTVAIGVESATGTTWLADGGMADTAPLHGYGDGSMTGYGWSWTGAPNASTSVRTITGTSRTYGDAGKSGRLTANNDGASPAYPVLRIDGPVANPSIEQVNTGGGLTIDGTIQAGEYLVIDTRTRAVLLMGSSPRRSWVRAGSTWPLLQPGSNTIAYRGSALPGASGQSSLLTVTWRDTSL
ncbi:phage tail family protein [Streptomyces sp. NBC_01108]|uniref:phage distal tail protein n=1 Tax=Streptomyces sp. NBC_01108 TaxID=2903751 RepID=UPI003873A17B|nr:phage tail family protein [Streptomyces sp. NBC_01108]